MPFPFFMSSALCTAPQKIDHWRAGKRAATPVAGHPKNAPAGKWRAWRAIVATVEGRAGRMVQREFLGTPRYDLHMT